MAKDDYYVIVAKILVFLYRRLKGQIETKPEDYIIAGTEEFPISDDYLKFVLESMTDHQMIKGVKVRRTWNGDDIMVSNLNRIQITQEGIDYLQENTTIRKIVKMIPGAAAIAELFI